MRFELWAPRAPATSTIVVDGREVNRCIATMTTTRSRSTRSPDPAAVTASASMAARCDPTPDRSINPDGVHDTSAVYDHSAFQWHDSRWPGFSLAGAVL